MRIVLQPSGACLELLPGERILDGARRLGYDCPQSCRNGNCHICAALLVEGGYAKTARYAIMANSSPASPSRWKTACCIGTGCWRRVNCLCAS